LRAFFNFFQSVPGNVHNTLILLSKVGAGFFRSGALFDVNTAGRANTHSDSFWNELRFWNPLGCSKPEHSRRKDIHEAAMKFEDPAYIVHSDDWPEDLAARFIAHGYYSSPL
jgi:hypothetical protein